MRDPLTLARLTYQAGFVLNVVVLTGAAALAYFTWGWMAAGVAVVLDFTAWTIGYAQGELRQRIEIEKEARDV